MEKIKNQIISWEQNTSLAFVFLFVCYGTWKYFIKDYAIIPVLIGVLFIGNLVWTLMLLKKYKDHKDEINFERKLDRPIIWRIVANLIAIILCFGVVFL